MYEHIYWAPEPFCSFLTACPDLYDRTVTINGVSKSYAMTGWRIGYCGGPVEIVTAMSTIQSQCTSNPVSISQKAATMALNGDQACVGEMNKHFKARHDYFNAGLNALPGFKVLPAAGTFYAWCDISEAMHMRGLADDNAFAEFLLEKAGVAGVPGSGFGAPEHIRFSFAVSMQTLEQALARMGKALAGA
jgi:aspartate aminotransferase